MNTAVYDFNDYSEARIRNNRIRRNRQLRKHIMLLVSTIIIILFSILILTSTKANASDGSEAKEYKYYKSIQIESGDSLWSISNEYSTGYENMEVCISEICFINNISEEDSLIPGNYIVVPYYSEYKN